MSDRLGRQFHALGTLAQIDAEILSKVDIDRVLSILPGRIREVAHADWRIRITSYNVCYTKLLRGEPIDLLPEVAACLRIDARGGLVE